MAPDVRLLLVEPDPSTAAPILQALTAAGYQVTHCQHLADAHAEPIDCIVFTPAVGFFLQQRFDPRLLLAQRLQTVGTLASGVAHEFNNLLAGIAGYAALALEEPLPAGPLRDYLDQVVELTARAGQMTRLLLGYSRRPTPRRQAVLLDDLIRQTGELVENTLRSPVELDIAAAIQVEADPGLLRQALVNLALNARDALPARSPITFRLGERTLTQPLAGHPDTVPAGKYALLEVADTGAGMTPEVVAQAVKPFFSTREGAGLGLPAVLAIVHAHDGYLTIESMPRQWTRVGLWLSLTAALQ